MLKIKQNKDLFFKIRTFPTSKDNFLLDFLQNKDGIEVLTKRISCSLPQQVEMHVF